MKKLLFLLLTAFAVTACNDDCNHGFDSNVSISDILVGSWYEETLNEEDTYNANGSLYARFCNTSNQGEGNGRYFIDSNRKSVTWSYTANGMERMEDWKISDVTDLGFTLKSDMAILNYGKVVEILNMKGGETRQIAFNQETVLGYESKNCNIANVTSDGLVTTTGEKGVTYVKIKLEQCNVWAKVIVGEDTPDLWVDYSFLLGQGYAEMKDFLGAAAQSEESGTNTIFAFETISHNILKDTYVVIENVSHTIAQIHLYIRSGVTNEEILTYMNSRYYLIANDNTQYIFSTSPMLEDSRAVYVFNIKEKVVFMMDASLYEELMNKDIVPKFNRFFGLDKEHVKLSAERRGWKYYDEFDSYSHNGSTVYTFSGYDYTNSIEFVYNSENLVSQCVVYMSSDTPNRLLLEYFEGNYIEAEDENTLLKHVYYNSAKTIKAEFDILAKTLYFTDIRQKLFDRVILGTYWKGMGKNKREVIDLFGEPYSSGSGEDADNMAYIIYGDHIQSVYFYFSKTTGKVIQINMQLQEEADDDEVIAYLNKWYHFLESEDTAQGLRMRWINSEKKENATLRATYYPNYNMMVYGIPE